MTDKNRQEDRPGVIAREEAYLERKFGGKYRRYKQSVRRWL
jgi:protein-S-isoprenylcysteine O-methyltransferase Ste14